MEDSHKKIGFSLLVFALAIIMLAGFVVYGKDTFKQVVDDSLEQAKQEMDQLKAENQQTPGASAEISYLKGAVEYKDNQADSQWKRASLEISLYQGYSLEILGEGRAIINLDDGSALRLNSNSKILLTSLDPSDIIIENQQGDVYLRVVQSDREFVVKAGQALYKSIGTSYRVLNTQDKQGVEVYQNKVQVEHEAVQPVTVEQGKKYYTRDAAKPEQVKKLVDLKKEEVEQDGFVMWNKGKDEELKADLGFLKLEEKPEEEATAAEDKKTTTSETTKPTGLYLSGKATTDGIIFNWTVNNVSITKGYKLVKSVSANPVYPGDKYVFLTDSAVKSYLWKITDGKTYYFRICQYLGGKCGLYSNNVKVTAPTETTEKKTDKTTTANEVKSISLSSSSNGKISWSVEGYSAKGFKVVWSKNSGPTYPTRSGDKYHYYSNSETRSDTVTAFDGDGTYYVRVCQYLGGKCGLYSNQVTVELSK